MATIKQGTTLLDIAEYLGLQQPCIDMEWKIRYKEKPILDRSERV